MNAWMTEIAYYCILNHIHLTHTPQYNECINDLYHSCILNYTHLTYTKQSNINGSMTTISSFNFELYAFNVHMHLLYTSQRNINASMTKQYAFNVHMHLTNTPQSNINAWMTTIIIRQIDLCSDHPLLSLGIRRAINVLFSLFLPKYIILHFEPYEF